MDVEDDQSEHWRYLTIYLQDHRAGAVAGVRLARRCRDHAPDDATAAELSKLVEEIEDDSQSLAAIMSGLGVDPSPLKQAAAFAGERVARLKPNGRLVRTSPLSIVVELEALIGAVSVKRQLWVTLSALGSTGSASAQKIEILAARAKDQRRRLQRLHGRMTQELFRVSGPATV